MAFLDQPVLVYGHEQEFGDHLALIESIATTVNGLGDVRWGDLETISRSNYSTWQGGCETLHIQPFARRIDVQVPAGVSRLVVEPLVAQPEPTEPEPVEHTRDDLLVLGDRKVHDVALDPGPGGRRIEITFAPNDAVDPDAVAKPQLRPGIVLRRIATEGRDRLHSFS